MGQTECSETSAYKVQTPGNYTEESIKQEEGRLAKFRTKNFLEVSLTVFGAWSYWGNPWNKKVGRFNAKCVIDWSHCVSLATVTDVAAEVENWFNGGPTGCISSPETTQLEQLSAQWLTSSLQSKCLKSRIRRQNGHPDHWGNNVLRKNVDSCHSDVSARGHRCSVHRVWKGADPRQDRDMNLKALECEENLAAAFGEDDDKEGDKVVERW